ncbi:type II toxin-antitoxin system HipA family toxin [Cereibacter sphaeroides]|uniref:type II toxin-antitoxin system HipA family toxin n=1 Tax=Cereibacter sphaeroides TaxID=1063 RepID=UPI001F460ECE|nr:HipA domain-containing protein [Cereibacter sphaeroides]MCE6967183.1 HipA domain-containing protein [Cereibacter sphaeroides]
MLMTFQIHADGAWHDAATVAFSEPARGIAGSTVTSYDTDYWSDFASRDGIRAPVIDRRAVSVRHPVNLEILRSDRWPAWLLDLMPQGIARTRIAREEGHRPDDPAVELKLLLRTGGAPIGNIRLKEAWIGEQARIAALRCPPLTDEDIEQRTEAFIEVVDRFAHLASGSSGVQGEWPKALMTRSSHDGRWYPDPFVPTKEGVEHVIVKLLKSSGDNDRLILEAEASYLEMARAFGLHVAVPLRPAPGVLVMPRFDRSVVDGQVFLHGQESLTSALGVAEFGVPKHHEDYLEAIDRFSERPAEDRLEYLMRDVLNLAAGNPDNHGRNTAFTRPANGGVRLSPLFDFAPMRLSDAGIARQSRWRCLDGNDPDGDWEKVCAAVACEGLRVDDVRGALIAALPFLRGLRGIAAEHGVPDEAIARAIAPERVVKAIEDLEDGPCPHGRR